MSIAENKENISAQIKLITKQINVIGQQSFIEPPPECRLFPTNVLKQKAGEEFEQAAVAYQNQLSQGMYYILLALDDMDRVNDSEEIRSWFKDNAEKVLELLKKGTLPEDVPIEQILDFPRTLLDAMHKGALYLLHLKKYKEATSAILTCLLFNATLFPIWFTYGMILQAKEDHQAAIYTFTSAAIFTENNPYPAAYSAKSWASLGNWDKSYQAISDAVKIAQTNASKYAEILNYCDNLKAWVDQQSNNR